jgi:acyl-[acyl-carrier-protein]-phospholipid O-acyltransferase/long-chain-fatty-acid--[acyl-carrier-protein] ligase
MNQRPPSLATPPRPASAHLEPPPSLRGFWALFVTQFQGAFSDNVYRTLAMFLFVNMTLPWHNDASRPLRMAVVGALFALPFILFSMAGGYLADRYSKRTVAIGTKIAEILIMGLATLALWWNEPVLLLATVFCMGAQSAFFGPTKYGLLPELLPERKLSWGNGVIELGTFLAIVAGTIGGGWLFEVFTGRQSWTGAILIGLAILGTVWSFGITCIPAADATKTFRPNFLSDLGKNLALIRRDRVLLLAIVGNTYFFFLGALVQQYTIYSYGKDLLGLSEGQITAWLMSAVALGIGFGSYAAGRLSGNKIEYGLIPLGSLGMTLAGGYLALATPTTGSAITALALYGFFCGFFIVPVTALIQHRPDRAEKGAIIAAGNLLSFVGIFLAAGVFYVFADLLNFDPRQIFLVTTVMTVAGTAYALWLLPDAVLRFIMWIATHTIYRIKVLGRDNIPAKGGALFVCNHLSLADATLLQAAVERPIRFIMLKAMYDKKFIGTWAKLTGAIPISSELRPREMIKSLQAASDAIQNGEIVCIFAEGQITRIGQMMPFRRGFERIMKGVAAPIIPVGLDGVWGSIFSFADHKFLWKWPRRFPYPITINFGPALPPTATPFEVRQTVQELLAEAWQERKKRLRPLHQQFVVTARRRPGRFAMSDAQTPPITFHGALVRSIFLARRLRNVWAQQEMVGLLLPPSVGGALANWAALFCGKVPVNLNYTLSEAALASCAKQCQLKTILTSRAFLDKAKLKTPAGAVFLEDVLGAPIAKSARSEDELKRADLEIGAPSAWEKLTALFIARCLPVAWIERAIGHRPSAVGNPLDALATIIFSSGSTGEPKGVMLSHYNVGSNIQQLGQSFAFGGKDKVLGVLPFFHSFGFTGTLMLPGVLGIGAVYHANPLDAKTIGQLVSEHEITFVLATPTFLQIYLRGCAAEQFGSVRLVAVGAEKLPDRLALAFEEQFGVRPFEAYGCTECSPAVTVNTHDFRAAGFRQVGVKRGKIGHPLPGVCVRIVDPAQADPNAPVPLGQSGLLLVRGPNVMLGYLGKPEQTAEVLRAGWYSTGDIAALDEDGFIQITDRLSRFSKIGGEMVPHIKIEEKLHEFAGVTEQTFVVSSSGDEKKGERLIVLHKLPEDQLAPVLAKLSASDLPNLWKPKADAFLHVAAFPLLGTGKLDLRKVKEIASTAA